MRVGNDCVQRGQYVVRGVSSLIRGKDQWFAEIRGPGDDGQVLAAEGVP